MNIILHNATFTVITTSKVSKCNTTLPGDKLDVLHGGLGVRHPQLQFEPPLRGGAGPQLAGLLQLGRHGEGVRAAGVGPQPGERDLRVAPPLQQQLRPRVEHEQGECAVQGRAPAPGQRVTRALGGGSEHPVLGVHEDAGLGEERLLHRVQLRGPRHPGHPPAEAGHLGHEAPTLTQHAQLRCVLSGIRIKVLFCYIYIQWQSEV